MGRLQILEKLSKKLESVPSTEEDIVYILSKVRKILEINNHPEKFSTLNFYCNLTLHAKLTKLSNVVKEMLDSVRRGEDCKNTIIGFSDFHDQMREFIKEYSLPNFYEKSTPEERQKLWELLLEIWSDTPIKIVYDVEWELIIKNNNGECDLVFGSKENILL